MRKSKAETETHKIGELWGGDQSTIASRTRRVPSPDLGAFGGSGLLGAPGPLASPQGYLGGDLALRYSLACKTCGRSVQAMCSVRLQEMSGTR